MRGLLEKYCRSNPYNWFNFFDFWGEGMGSSGRCARGRAGCWGPLCWGWQAWRGGAAVSAAAATAQDLAQDLDKLMALLAQRQHGHVTFVEEHFLAVLDRPVESSGELLYDAPDHLEKRTLKPKPETVVFEHGVITAHRGRHTYVLNLSDYPADRAAYRQHTGDAGGRPSFSRAHLQSHVRRHVGPLDATAPAFRHLSRKVGEADPHRRRAGRHSFRGNTAGRWRPLAVDHRARSPAMTRPGVVGTLVWVVLAAIAAVVVVRARYTTDLSAFLPKSPTATQRLLVDQLRDGLASRLIIVAIEGADSQTRARISVAMAERLRPDAQFVSINNGESAGMDRDRAFLFEHRYLLSDSVTPERFTVEGLKEAIQDTVDLLASPAGLLVKELLPHDPTGEMVEIVGQLGGGGAPRTENGVWSSGDGKRALIVAQTRALGSDTDGQQRAVEAIRRAFAAADGRGSDGAAPANGQAAASGAAPANGQAGASSAASAGGQAGASSATAANAPAAPNSPHRVTLLMSGPGVFAVNSRATIIKEVTRLSILSTAVIVALLLGVYRSATALVLGLVPVASGALAGVAAVALGLGVVHGITLGFGVTLIGEAVDYSIYLFIQRDKAPQARRPRPASRTPAPQRRARGSPTRARGALGLAALRVADHPARDARPRCAGLPRCCRPGFSGLAQLGLYSIAGLVAAGLVTRFVLPHWLPRNFAIRDVSPIGVAVSRLLQRVKGAPVIAIAVAALAGIVLYIHRDTLWNRELSALSPVSLADQDLDAQLRVDIRAPDVRYLVVVSAPDEQSTLDVAEKVGARLDKLVDADVIGGFDSPAHYLPSQAATTRTSGELAGLPTSCATRLQKAVVGMPVRAERLRAFPDRHRDGPNPAASDTQGSR